MKAIIKLDVPDWQIGKKVSVYFPDTMVLNSICEIDNTDNQFRMRDATEEERKSTQDYIRSISKPTGIQFDEVVEELDFVQEHPKVRTKLKVNNVTNKRQIVKDWLSTFNTESATECYTAVRRLKAEVEE